MYCKHCGTMISESHKFCNNCGKEIKQSGNQSYSNEILHDSNQLIDINNLSNNKIKYVLPSEVVCPHCQTILELDHEERMMARFTCAQCNKEILIDDKLTKLSISISPDYKEKVSISPNINQDHLKEFLTRTNFDIGYDHPLIFFDSTYNEDSIGGWLITNEKIYNDSLLQEIPLLISDIIEITFGSIVNSVICKTNYSQAELDFSSTEDIRLPIAEFIQEINGKRVINFDHSELTEYQGYSIKDELISIGDITPNYNVNQTRILKYTVEISHFGLNEYKLLSAPERDHLDNKIHLQITKWEDKWEKIKYGKASIEEATKQSSEAKKQLKEIDNLLINVLNVDNKIEWENIKKSDKFDLTKPQKPVLQSKQEFSPKPDKNDVKFIPNFTIWHKIIPPLKQMKIDFFENNFQEALKCWNEKKITIETENIKVDNRNKELMTKWDGDVEKYEKNKQEYYNNQNEFNLKIDEIKEKYINKAKTGIIKYYEMVLNNSEYPDFFIKDFELEYISETKILIVEYQLPSIESFPRLNEVRYIKTKNELVKSYLSDIDLNKMFDEALYKITLRTLYEIFDTDTIDAIDAVSFNGWITAINKANGKEEHNCILSIQVRKKEFVDIDLSRVDPKICFKNLKGVSSSKLSTLTPVQPIMQISREDKRFVSSYEVSNKIDDKTNLAAMDWEDFEHLIRELFEKEFSVNGGEVKVTQASRDGGVDAIAFDPDPIRGGKIVIQAKRYTNTVAVSAVRDLFGTVMNEGATKGILVTTADYGPDAYEFAKGKPITLLNGSNLLHLLEKHGTHAKIDIREAKKIFRNQ